VPKIFEDLTENFVDSNYILANPNMTAFSYPNKSEVTIIVSKNAGRYRIQSNNYESLLFITNQILNRLNDRFNYEVNFYIEDDINLLNYFLIVENHFKIHNLKKTKNKELEKFTNLYTVIQKSLLNKYKVKNVFT
jgi:Bardet-Biedl syndrome 9 protein